MNNLQLDEPLLSLLMPWYREVADYQEICRTEEAQLEQLAADISAVADNFFFQTMDEGAVEQWEQVFRIVPNPQTETLAFRRERLINRISLKPPFTLGFLYQRLDALIGKGKYIVHVDYPNYTLYIQSSAQNQPYAQEIAVTMNTIKPCHIVYINMPYTASGLTLEESVELYELTWNYRLSYWGLGAQPFAQDESKGVIVMPEQKTMQPAIFTNVAGFLQSNVASARINGTIAIGEVTNTVTGNTVNVKYTVTPEQTDVVTQIELLDAEGNVLTSAGVYVPVATATAFSHDITVEEAN